MKKRQKLVHHYYCPLPEVLGDIVLSFIQLGNLTKNEFLIFYHYIGPHLRNREMWSIRLACCYGCVSIVKQLLTNTLFDSYIRDYEDLLLYYASIACRTTIIKVLLQDSRFNPVSNDCIAIQTLIALDEHDYVLQLMKDPRVLLELFMKSYPNAHRQRLFYKQKKKLLPKSFMGFHTDTDTDADTAR